MQKAIRIHEVGGTDKLKYEECEIPKPDKNQVLVENHIAGVNFIDTYHRSGLYKVQFPFTVGRDGAGIIKSLGEGVTEFKVGDRVAYPSNIFGSYAEYTTVSDKTVVKLPNQISFEQGTSSMVTGLTAQYLVRASYCVKKGDRVLIHASAGSLGQALVQICKHLGAFVIGTASNEEKLKISKNLGCDEVINYKEKKFDDEVKRITNGKGCNVVYDGVGKDTYEGSINSCGIRGTLVFCGNASGKVPPIEPTILSERGSLTLIRPSLFHYILTREELNERCAEVFQWIEQGVLKLAVDSVLPLSEAAKAQDLLESRNAIGKVLLKTKLS